MDPPFEHRVHSVRQRHPGELDLGFLVGADMPLIVRHFGDPLGEVDAQGFA